MQVDDALKRPKQNGSSLNGRIIIGIPTYNESNSIRNIVKTIDKGLRPYFTDLDIKIVNVDGNSTDSTQAAFLATKTSSQKIGILNDALPGGKGANVLKLIKISKKENADVLCILDADTKTFSSRWIKKMIDPVINRKADFVTPIYKRNRYEANTTNHFCYPITNLLSEEYIAQPIGGDFAMGKKFICHISDQAPVSSVYAYGIDIFLTLSAIFNGFKIKSVPLGRKIHNPSFEKIEEMFKQVAATSFYMVSKYNGYLHDIPVQKLNKGVKYPRIDMLTIKPSPQKIERQKINTLLQLEKLKTSKTDPFIAAAAEIYLSKGRISGKEWAVILSDFLYPTLHCKINYRTAKNLADKLAPFFLLRVSTYFTEINRQKNAEYADSIIENEAQNLRHILISAREHPKSLNYPTLIN
jgi:glycosyltransferase involved in cell wall biosynthesis